ncbi:DinB family protein [Marinoscillum furvescens]|uniref:Uncharacterized protein DUF664 n=1 Tax=Marinoscillum furvescens DSM 4134 TaxID=1122208 RepID=A0A3D9LI76_MARFU|nr:DinB family protein [Marinoscillum furvescens]REE05565.1 uncharacterized protein DUF664 [Marinoscillum furvescens DSM 4134]
MEHSTNTHRRNFLFKAGLATVGLGMGSGLGAATSGVYQPEDLHIVGPRAGYSPQIGTLVSMMTWMRTTVLRSVRGLSVEELDFLLDDEANSIGAMLLHLAATERYYQLHTFEGLDWGDWPQDEKEAWDAASGLGDAAREQIKGQSLDYYLEKLKSVRERTLQEFAKRDDDWLMAVDEDWFWGRTNNYCKWFHVCEHESNHNGQIKLIKSRVV